MRPSTTSSSWHETTSPIPNPGQRQSVHEAGPFRPSRMPPPKLGLAPSTLHRWLADGFIAGEQTTPRRAVTYLHDRSAARTVRRRSPSGWAMLEASLTYGLSGQALVQRVKRGELCAVHVRSERRRHRALTGHHNRAGLLPYPWASSGRAVVGAGRRGASPGR